jgi:hypothetical protein
MKYLSSKPFTIPVYSPTWRGRTVYDLASGERDRRTQRERAAKPHEFLNSGVMCQICSLGREAKIHENQT